MAINALNETRGTQQHLTQKTFPLLYASENLSRSIFDYINYVENISNINISHSPEKEKALIQSQKNTLDEHVKTLKNLTPKHQYMNDIEMLLNNLHSTSSLLTSLLYDERSQLLGAIANHKNDINILVNQSHNTTQRHQIVADAALSHHPIPHIETALSSIKGFMKEYSINSTQVELQRLKINYIKAVKKIAQQSEGIEDNATKITLAENANGLLKHGVSRDGFFSDAIALTDNIKNVDSAIRYDKAAEKKLNLLLNKLIATTGEQVNEEIQTFTDTLDNTITLMKLLFIASIISACAIIICYIIPYITRRLTKLSDSTQRIAAKEYDTPIDISGNDEISQLSRALEEFRAVMIAKDEVDKFQELIKESNPDFIFVKDENFIIVEANKAFLSAHPEEMRDKVIGSTATETHTPDEVEELLKMDKLAFKEGFSETIENMTFYDGKECILHTQKIRFKNTQGENFILGISRDVTEREALVKRLANSNEELERFAFVCSHDLQEPLRMIRSFSDLLQSHLEEELKGDEKAERYFNFIKDGAERSQHLISDILSYSSIHNSTEIREDVSIEDIIDIIKENLGEVLTQSGGVITHEALPIITGNRTQLYQLFQNVINNGVKYQTADNIPHITIKVEEQDELWKFSISDNGIGIEERHLAKIFDVFHRLHRSTDYAGTGIGLAICKKVAESHGGEIWLESTFGEGSTFHFTLHKA